ncbi:MAG TPA: hypothetical protein VFB29_02985 [Pseudolabrys sp.]|nr:hypothetical protein [Pseudolabrys sp.]
MRALMLALAGILICAAAAAAQTVIDVENPRSAGPPVQDQPQAAPQVQTQSAPAREAPAQSKDDEPLPPAGGGRFTFNRIDNGVLRLDTQTGEVAVCRAQSPGWICQDVPDKRSEQELEAARRRADLAAIEALTSEVARLRDEIASLKREVAALKEPPPPRPPADLAPPGKDGDAVIRLPTQQDIARARDFIEKAWHRVVDMITAVQKDMMQKS